MARPLRRHPPHARGARLFLDDTPGLVLRDLEARAWWLKAQHPDLALLVVDYLQLVTAGVRVEQRRLEIALITRRLKELAGELGVPVIALSQLNRELTRRSDPRPQLADLAESGAIEQDADQVAFIHRPEVYDPDDARPPRPRGDHRRQAPPRRDRHRRAHLVRRHHLLPQPLTPAPAGPEPF